MQNGHWATPQSSASWFCISYKIAKKSTASLEEPGHDSHTFPTYHNQFYVKDYLGAFNGMIKIEK